MKRFKYFKFFLVFAFLLIGLRNAAVDGQSADASNKSTLWIQPTQKQPQSLWGFKNGIRIGLNSSSIRGLIMIYTPYLGQEENDVINFFAIEPIVLGDYNRGFSELEYSDLDRVQGKRIWSADDASDFGIKDGTIAARGIISHENGVETLTIFLFVELFNNGAKVYLRVRFYADNPNEVELSTFRCPGSKELSNCIVTATMGNYARLRKLYLNDGIKSSKLIWPDYSEKDFTPHNFIAKEQMIHSKKGFPYLIATPDETNPGQARYADDTPVWWRYYGMVATQYWYCTTPQLQLQGLVNGRVVYWGDHLPIPGGISFENFELKQPFREGDRFVFGISPLSAEEFIEHLN